MAFSSWFPLFHYLFVTSLLCSRLRLSLPLLGTSLLCSRLRLSLPLFVTSLFIQAISVAPLPANYDSEALCSTDVLEFDAEAPQATASERLA